MSDLSTIKVIKTAEQHKYFVDELLRLMETGGNDDHIELLALVIEQYERKVSPSPFVDPIEAIRFRMDQMGMKAKDLAPYIGSQGKVSDVLNRKRPLTLAMIRNLHKGLGIPAEVLLNESQGDIDLSIDVPDLNDIPFKEMAKRGCFGTEYIAASLNTLKQNAEELFRFFLSTHSMDMQAYLRAPQTQTGTRSMNEMALSIWVSIVQKKAKEQDIKVPYKPNFITEDWLKELVKLSSFNDGPKLAKEYLARVGIALVIEPHFEKTYLDGAAMMLDDRAVVGMTLRHDRVDNFWFVLLHELAHIKYHLKDSNSYLIDDIEDKVQQSDEKEQEADDLAQEILIPKQVWMTSQVRHTYSAQDALLLAEQLSIDPAIVAGRLRRETGNWRLLHTMLGKDKVKTVFRLDNEK